MALNMMQQQPVGANSSNLTTPMYDGGGGFHSAMPKVDFFGDLANPYRMMAGRPKGSGSAEKVPSSRFAGMQAISPHIDNEQAFSMMNDLGQRVDYGDNLNDFGNRLATFNSSEQTGSYPLDNNATQLSRSGPVTNGFGLSI